MQHLFFFFLSASSLGCRDSSLFFSSLKISSNNSLILMLFLAEVSRYFTFHIFYKINISIFTLSKNPTDYLTSSASPVLVDTWRLPDSSSHLFPTSSTGQPSRLPFTSLISSSTGFSSSKLCREDIENTIMNAWPEKNDNLSSYKNLNILRHLWILITSA